MYTLNLLLLYQITFQYAFWDKFKDLGSLSSANLTNLRFLLTHLIVTRSLSLAVVRVSTRVTLSHLHNHILMTWSHYYLNRLLSFQSWVKLEYGGSNNSFSYCCVNIALRHAGTSTNTPTHYNYNTYSITYTPTHTTDKTCHASHCCSWLFVCIHCYPHRSVFSRLAPHDHLRTLRDDLMIFMRHFLVSGHQQQDTSSSSSLIQSRIKIAEQALRDSKH